jgi:putative transposase
LDHRLILRNRHSPQVLAIFHTQHNNHRPHQSRKQLPPNHNADQGIEPTARIQRKDVLGGLINEYHQAA